MNEQIKTKNTFFQIFIFGSILIAIYILIRVLFAYALDIDVKWQIRSSISITFVILFVMLWGLLKKEKYRNKVKIQKTSKSEEFSALPIVILFLYGFSSLFVLSFLLFQILNEVLGNDFFIMRDIVGISFVISGICVLFTHFFVSRIRD